MTHPDDALFEASTAASAAAATSYGPPPLSDAPGDDQEPLSQPGSDDEQPDEQPDTEPEESISSEPAEFDPRHREAFTGLAFLGYLEKTVNVWGHTFRLTTPNQMEKIQLGQIHREYSMTMASDLAYQTLWVASALQAVDGTDLPRPVTNDPKDNGVRDRFRWVGENLRGPVIDRLFDECMLLEAKVREVLAAMGEA